MLDSQVARGGTLLLSAYHVAQGAGSRARRFELELLRNSVEHFNVSRFGLPRPASINVPRQLYASITISRDALGSAWDVDALVRQYEFAEVDGFWVRLEGFTEESRLSEIALGADFLGSLAALGKPVVCVGARHLHTSLLVSDISSSIGFGERERFFVPEAPGSQRRGARVRAAYHPIFMRGFDPTKAPANTAFRLVPCRCGAHPADKPPQGSDVGVHNVRARLGERFNRAEPLSVTAKALVSLLRATANEPEEKPPALPRRPYRRVSAD